MITFTKSGISSPEGFRGNRLSGDKNLEPRIRINDFGTALSGSRSGLEVSRVRVKFPVSAPAHPRR